MHRLREIVREIVSGKIVASRSEGVCACGCACLCWRSMGAQTLQNTLFFGHKRLGRFQRLAATLRPFGVILRVTQGIEKLRYFCIDFKSVKYKVSEAGTE